MCKRTLLISFVSLSINVGLFLLRHDVYNRLGSTILTQDTIVWPKVRKFLNRIASQHQHALVADVGMLKCINLYFRQIFHYVFHSRLWQW